MHQKVIITLCVDSTQRQIYIHLNDAVSKFIVDIKRDP